MMHKSTGKVIHAKISDFNIPPNAIPAHPPKFGAAMPETDDVAVFVEGRSITAEQPIAIITVEMRNNRTDEGLNDSWLEFRASSMDGKIKTPTVRCTFP